MRKLQNYAKFIFVGFLAGYFFAFLFGQWTWLAMRINTGLMLPIFSTAGFFMVLWNNCLRNKLWLIISQLAAATVFLFFYWQSLDAIFIIPGIMFREGFGLEFLSLTQANGILLGLCVAGNVLWVFSRNDHCETKGRDMDA